MTTLEVKDHTKKGSDKHPKLFMIARKFACAYFAWERAVLDCSQLRGLLSPLSLNLTLTLLILEFWVDRCAFDIGLNGVSVLVMKVLDEQLPLIILANL